ncbi:unnamed protein product [Gongylonema pulchrum]|uniref:Pribosyltran domain-containing protein n=1 Tax=Gongylonema pulchrum TaxID=637853 RepID=A0A183ELP8_9BILA|nr:unnamed protein product [Gongylonema pulchrum]
MHAVCSRSAIYHLNELAEDRQFDQFLKQKFTGKSVICIDDGSLIGLMLAKYAKVVEIIRMNPHFLEITLGYITTNAIRNVYASQDENYAICDRVSLKFLLKVKNNVS